MAHCQTSYRGKHRDHRVPLLCSPASFDTDTRMNPKGKRTRQSDVNALEFIAKHEVRLTERLV